MKKENTPNVLIIVAVLLFITTCLLFFIGPEFIQSRYSAVDFDDRGGMGDAFGGTIGPIIAWIAAILTFAAFYVQYESNKEQRLQFEKQANDTVIERFENQFFEMVRLHRANVEEQNVQDIIKGRKVFTTYYFELRYIFFVLQDCYNTNKPETELSIEELTNLAYLIFFFGIGHVTEGVLDDLAPAYNKLSFFENAINKLEKAKTAFDPNTKTIQKDLEVDLNGKKAVFKQVYQPFTGHGTKIGHYYRHMFQTVKYVSEQTHELFSPELKYSYVKILRAQLSNFEQVMFYYNVVSLLGKRWIENGYIKDYLLIKNLPLSFADFGVLPEEKFKREVDDNKDFFQWHTLKRELYTTT